VVLKFYFKFEDLNIGLLLEILLLYLKRKEIRFIDAHRSPKTAKGLFG
jgi:hypothetical protein